MGALRDAGPGGRLHPDACGAGRAGDRARGCVRNGAGGERRGGRRASRGPAPRCAADLATGGFGTAGGVLRTAWERDRLAQVWVDETRPLLQGARLTAWELRRAGIPFRVVADSAAGGLMARGLVDRIVVGADRIAA